MTILEWLELFPGAQPGPQGPQGPQGNPGPQGPAPDLSSDVEVGFYPDLAPAKIRRFRDRVFVGDACEATGDWAEPRGGAWLTLPADGSDWAIRDATLLSMSPNGKMAIVGITKSGENQDGHPVAAGVAGLVINDKPNAAGWGVYSDVQHETGKYSYGLEVAAKNKGVNHTSAPYFLTEGVYGIWLAGGGDHATGGAGVNPPNTAILIGKNAMPWNKGIVFGKDGLSGSFPIAIHMPKSYRIVWDTPSGQEGASIRSEATDNAKRLSVQFGNDNFMVVSANGTPAFSAVHVTDGVNFLYQQDAAAGGDPSLGVQGPDTDIDLKLAPKGAGLVVVGPYDAATNSISVKDTAGNIRRLQCT
jgi:hypothetical protein